MSHLGGYIADGDANTYTPDIWGWLLVEYDIKSVLDIGCGTGKNIVMRQEYTNAIGK